MSTCSTGRTEADQAHRCIVHSNNLGSELQPGSFFLRAEDFRHWIGTRSRYYWSRFQMISLQKSCSPGICAVAIFLFFEEVVLPESGLSSPTRPPSWESSFFDVCALQIVSSRYHVLLSWVVSDPIVCWRNILVATHGLECRAARLWGRIGFQWQQRLHRRRCSQ